MTPATPSVGAALVAGVTLMMLAALGLGGCGQTGPLYLPDSGSVVTRPAPSAPAATPAPTTASTPAPTPAGSAPPAAPVTPPSPPPAALPKP